MWRAASHTQVGFILNNDPDLRVISFVSAKIISLFLHLLQPPAAAGNKSRVLYVRSKGGCNISFTNTAGGRGFF